MTTPNYYLTFGEDAFNRVGRLANPIEEYMFIKWTSTKYRMRIGLKPTADPSSDLTKIINLRNKMEDLEEHIIEYITETFGKPPVNTIEVLHNTMCLHTFYTWLNHTTDKSTK